MCTTRARGYRPEEYRWGQGGAKIIDYHIQSAGVDFPPSLTGNQQTDFLMKVVFEYDFDCVVPGLLIKTLDGLFLYGTNSFLGLGRPGKHFGITWGR